MMINMIELLQCDQWTVEDLIVNNRRESMQCVCCFSRTRTERLNLSAGSTNLQFGVFWLE